MPNTPAARSSIRVLLVEDDPGDVLMVREALSDQGLSRLTSVRDGVEALRFLRKEAEFSGVERPDLILLDLNMPRKDGREVLAEVKGDADLRSIPVVVLTTSRAEKDVLSSYQLHANAYVTKPADFEQFIDVTRRIEGFFVDVASLPGR